MPRLDAWAGQVAVHADLCTAASGRRTSARPVCSPAMPMTMGDVVARRAHNQVMAHDLPGRLALAAHVLDREQEFLSVAADAEHCKQRDCRGLSVHAHPHHRPVQDEEGRAVAGGVTPVPGLQVGPTIRCVRLKTPLQTAQQQARSARPDCARHMSLSASCKPAIGGSDLADPPRVEPFSACSRARGRPVAIGPKEPDQSPP
jgi:hypothetical protein